MCYTASGRLTKDLIELDYSLIKLSTLKMDSRVAEN